MFKVHATCVAQLLVEFNMRKQPITEMPERMLHPSQSSFTDLCHVE